MGRWCDGANVGGAGNPATSGFSADRPSRPVAGEERGGVVAPSADGGQRVWRLLDAGAAPRRGAHNMGIDRAVAESVEAGGPAALRFYYWEPPCLSLGRNQPAVDVYDRAAAAARGIDIVRRPTGGRAVLHDRELTYCVAVPVGQLGPPRETYAAINRALVAGLRRLGVAARVVSERSLGAAAPAGGMSGGGGIQQPSREAAGVRDQRPAPWQEALGPTPCFDAAAPGEVVAEGRKLIGSAQRKEGRVLLQHGSLLLEGDQSAVVELLLEPPPFPPALLPRPATLRELLGTLPQRAELESALVAGFEEALGIRLAPAALSSAEREAAERWTRHFASDDWTWRK